MLLREPSFPLADNLELVALQGDCGLKNDVSADGGRWVLADPTAARLACLRLIEHARTTNSQLALVPEMGIPLQAIPDIIHLIMASPMPLVLIGGIEGLSRRAYRELVAQHGSPLDVSDTTPGTFVNPMLVVVRTTTDLKVIFRAKCYASGPENRGGPEMAQGQNEFIVLELGSVPFVVIPLICSELLQPRLWDAIGQQKRAQDIDLVPVLQRNNDIEKRYWGPVIHEAYQHHDVQARFVLANQGLMPSSDGTCFVLTPPGSPGAPGFDHGRNELWLPSSCTYKGFRIPERTGCFWHADVLHRNGHMDATRPPICRGKVLEVLTPTDVDLAGLPAGLLRSAAASKAAAIDPVSDQSWESNETKRAYRSSLLPSGCTYLLKGTSAASLRDGFQRMIASEIPTWETVEAAIDDAVEAAALLACGGDSVQIGPCPGGNCRVSGRSVAILYAPSVYAALSECFSDSARFSGQGLPSGVVLLNVNDAPPPRAITVGDVLRADRVSSQSPELTDGPMRIPDDSSRITADDIHFCQLPQLRPGLARPDHFAARTYLSDVLPGVYI